MRKLPNQNLDCSPMTDIWAEDPDKLCPNTSLIETVWNNKWIISYTNSFVVICYTVKEKNLFATYSWEYNVAERSLQTSLFGFNPLMASSGELDWEIQALEGSFHQNYRSTVALTSSKGYVNVLTIIPVIQIFPRDWNHYTGKRKEEKTKIFLMHATMLIIFIFC